MSSSSVHNHTTYARGSVRLLGIALNVYIYLTDGVLVDTGPSSLRKTFVPFFREHAIDQVVLTHHHEDHAGNTDFLTEKNIPVYINSTATGICRQPAKLPLYRQIFWGGRKGFAALPLPGAIQGQRHTWQVIDTPGHSFDHIALLNPETGALFTGDLFVSPKTKIIMETENIPETMSSLRKLLELDFGTVYCGHCGVVERGRELLSMKLNFLENLTGQVMKLHDQGWTVKEINKKLFPQKPPLTYISLGQWSSRHIIGTIIGQG